MNKSFTLIEILVVIVIVGILSSFILVGMSSITNSANIAKSKAFSDSLDNSLLLARVSQWKLDEGTGTTTYDSWGTNNGTLTNGPTWVTSGCISNNCLSFDGTDDYVLTTFNPSNYLITGSPFTVSVWTYITDKTTSRNIIATTSTPRFYLRSNDGAVGIGSSSILDCYSLNENVWQNLVVVFTGTQIKSFLNVDTKIIKNYGGDGAFPNENMRISINTLPFAGRIDELSIYNRELSASQMKQNYFLGLSKLFKNNGITLNEFNERMVELKSSLAK
ncbi:MAG: hypothetical protein MCSN_4000 [Candidatus Microsyncoccus archaeolyticus]|nr:MAG: hypothetical protein MCSN_4000 [Candidatus Parcubacteria bacterium]